jgi:hypothetical protein
MISPLATAGQCEEALRVFGANQDMLKAAEAMTRTALPRLTRLTKH